jgi:formate/nitrite transporter
MGNTSSMMCAWLERRCTWRTVGRNWLLTFAGNWLGCVACAFVLGHLTEVVHEDPYRSYLLGFAEKKMALGFGSVVLRAVGCNWLLCIGLFSYVTTDSLGSKLPLLILPVCALVVIGFEHVVANMFTLSLVVMEGGTSFTYADVVLRNILPATIGTMIGGAGMVASTEWIIFRKLAATRGDELGGADAPPPPVRARVIEGAHDRTEGLRPRAHVLHDVEMGIVEV